jgi:hypothetical protein
MEENKKVFKRMGVRWDDNERELLLKGVSEGKCLKELSIIHERTERGIELQLKDIASNMYLENVSMSDIEKKTGVSEIEIAEFLEKRKNQKEKKNKNSKTDMAISNLEKTLKIANMKLDKILNLLENLELVES